MAQGYSRPKIVLCKRIASPGFGEYDCANKKWIRLELTICISGCVHRHVSLQGLFKLSMGYMSENQCRKIWGASQPMLYHIWSHSATCHFLAESEERNDEREKTLKKNSFSISYSTAASVCIEVAGYEYFNDNAYFRRLNLPHAYVLQNIERFAQVSPYKQLMFFSSEDWLRIFAELYISIIYIYNCHCCDGLYNI